MGPQSERALAHPAGWRLNARRAPSSQARRGHKTRLRGLGPSLRREALWRVSACEVRFQPPATRALFTGSGGGAIMRVMQIGNRRKSERLHPAGRVRWQQDLPRPSANSSGITACTSGCRRRSSRRKRASASIRSATWSGTAAPVPTPTRCGGSPTRSPSPSASARPSSPWPGPAGRPISRRPAPTCRCRSRASSPGRRT